MNNNNNNNYNYTQVRLRIGMVFMIDEVKYRIIQINNGIITCTSANYGVSYMSSEDLASDFYNGNVTIVYGRKGGDLDEWIQK